MPQLVHHRDKTPLCDMTEYPPAGGCHLFFLTDRELWITQSLLFPFAQWQTRYVYPLGGDLYRIVPDEEFLEISDVVEGLEVQLWGGINMDCSELLGVGYELAEAIKAIRCTTNVSCGAGAAGPPGYVPPLAGTLSPLAPEDFNGPPGITEPDPEGDPPEGFDTWESYRTHKCQAAHYIFGIVRAAAVACQALSGFQLMATIVAPVAAGLAGLLPVVFTPAGFVIFVGALVTVGTLHILAFSQMSQMIARLDAEKGDIVCALYTSGDAATAMDVLADAIEDAIEFIVFSGVLGPLSAAIKAALGMAFTQFVNTNVVNVMFRVVEDFTFPDADCSYCDEPPPEEWIWHFDASQEGWYWDDPNPPAGWSYESYWVPNANEDPLDSSPGHLFTRITSPGNSDWYPGWVQNVEAQQRVVKTGEWISVDMACDATARTDTQLQMHFTDATVQMQNWTPLQQTGWQEYGTTVAAQHNGKTLKHIKVCLRISYSGGGVTREYHVDRARMPLT